jgi:hypothetical protein
LSALGQATSTSLTGRIVRSAPSELALQSLRDQGEKFADQTQMMIVASGVLGVCIRQKQPRLMIQEPDIVIRELRLKDGHVEIVEELRLIIECLPASPLPPAEGTHAPQPWESELEELTVDFLLATHTNSAQVKTNLIARQESGSG